MTEKTEEILMDLSAHGEYPAGREKPLATLTVETNPSFEMRIMDPEAGDLRVEWDKNDPVQVAAAEEAFRKATKKGNMIFYKTKRDGLKGERITEFDASAERIVGMPMVVGG
jgi:GH25 family lysozyme M1 (1,4-beta-N-acetylmuramidase)